MYFYLFGDRDGEITGDSCGDSNLCERTGRNARGSSIAPTLLNAVNAPLWKNKEYKKYYIIYLYMYITIYYVLYEYYIYISLYVYNYILCASRIIPHDTVNLKCLG